ncbi:MAG: ATP-binding cassette domain-containing protein [bacterium]|nr:ATP-binding cassette domain-containing protein [bacterium]
MIDLKNVEFSYPNTSSAYDFSLQCAPGSCTLIQGKSGSGKSTLLSLISGFSRPHSGTILLQQENKTQTRIHERPVSFLFQNHNTFPQLSVFENVALGLAQGRGLTPNQKSHVDDILDQVGLLSHKEKKPENLSGGEHQRVGLARCLLMRRPILLMDEPFSALDEETETELVALTQKLQQEFYLTLVIAAHRTNLLESLSPTRYRIHSGKIIQVCVSPDRCETK